MIYQCIMRVRFRNVNWKVKKIICLSLVLLFSFLSWIIINVRSYSKEYLIFVEFANAHGIQPGTPLRLRGYRIGSVTDISTELNSILVLIKIDSSLIIIPRNSVIEINQTGLLNDSVIDILPLEYIFDTDLKKLDPFDENCINSNIVCHLSYLEGDRGLNYDDLVRATTRIAQRFDDPSFFNLFYVFLYQGIKLSDNLLAILLNFHVDK
jgi:phospholipid/cholesterol/gamma-HCH transport system substrate-binding protein